MANEVKVSFTPQDAGLVAQIETIRSRMPEIERAASAAGAAVDNVTRRTQAEVEASLRLAQANAQAHRERVAQLERESSLIERLARARAEQIRAERQAAGAGAGSAPPGGLPPLGISTGGLRTGGTGINAGPITDADVYKHTEAQIAFERQLRRVSQGYDQAAAAGQRFHGVTLIGSTILRQFGVEGSRGIEVVSRQLIMLAEDGKNVKQILEVLNSSKLLGFTVLAAGALAVVESWKKVTDAIRESYQELLKIEERGAKVADTGLFGGRSQTSSDLQKLYDLQRDYNLLSKAGRDEEAFRLTREAGVPIYALQSRIDEAKRRAEALGLDTRSQAEIDRAKQLEEFDKKRVHDAQELFRVKVEGFNREDQLRKQRQLEDERAIKAAQQFFATALGGAIAGTDYAAQLAALDVARGPFISDYGKALGQRYADEQSQSIQRDTIDRQLEIARRFYGAAQSPEQRQAAIDAALKATAGGNLTADETDARRTFLQYAIQNQGELLRSQIEREQRAQISQDKFTASLEAFAAVIKESLGVEVVIRNEAPESASTRVQQELGPQPSAEFGNSLSNNF